MLYVCFISLCMLSILYTMFYYCMFTSVYSAESANCLTHTSPVHHHTTSTLTTSLPPLNRLTNCTWSVPFDETPVHTSGMGVHTTPSGWIRTAESILQTMGEPLKACRHHLKTNGPASFSWCGGVWLLRATLTCHMAMTWYCQGIVCT